jgi:predicted component of type VI protein secretion system
MNCARIMRTAAGILQLDYRFVAPCLQIGASATLMQVLRSVGESLVGTRAALVRASPSVMEQSRRDLLLRDLNAAIVCLLRIFRAGREHPKAAYRNLLNVAETLLLVSPSFDPAAVLQYDHFNAAKVFLAIADTIRQMAQAVTA